MESVAVDKITSVLGYIDALRDLGVMPPEIHAKALDDLHDARAFILQSLNRYECLVKGK